MTFRKVQYTVNWTYIISIQAFFQFMDLNLIGLHDLPTHAFCKTISPIPNLILQVNLIGTCRNPHGFHYLTVSHTQTKEDTYLRQTIDEKHLKCVYQARIKAKSVNNGNIPTTKLTLIIYRYIISHPTVHGIIHLHCDCWALSFTRITVWLDGSLSN